MSTSDDIFKGMERVSEGLDDRCPRCYSMLRNQTDPNEEYIYVYCSNEPECEYSKQPLRKVLI